MRYLLDVQLLPQRGASFPVFPAAAVLVGVVCFASVATACAGGAEPLAAEPGEQVRYGDGPKHFGIISRPEAPGLVPVAVLIHGGFWRDGFTLELMSALTSDLLDRGYAVWNLEYRGVGEAGGGFPETFDDITRGVNHLTTIGEDYGLDLDRVAFIGHSAGGHLALWAGGADLGVDPVVVIGQAAVVDLYAAAEEQLGRGAVQELLGGEPDEWPERYTFAQPVLDDRVVLVHGDADDIVPVTQSTGFADQVPVVVIEGEGHFEHLDPTSNSWAAVIDALGEL